MKKSIIIAILSLLVMNCKGQDKNLLNTNKAKDTMEYFNENRYKDWELDKKNSSVNDRRYIKDNKWVRVTYDGEYSEEISKINSPYKEYKYYNKNYLLKSKIITFYTFPIGIKKEYNENGNLVKEINYNEPYKFTVENLVNKIKNEFGIDLVKDYKSSEAGNFYVSRWTGYKTKFLYYPPNIPIYQVNFLNKNSDWVYLEISGIDGDIITEKINDKYVIPKDYNPELKQSPNEKNKSTSFLASPNEKGASKKSELGIAYVEGNKIPESTYQIYEGRAYTKTEWEEFQKTLPWWKRIL